MLIDFRKTPFQNIIIHMVDTKLHIEAGSSHPCEHFDLTLFVRSIGLVVVYFFLSKSHTPLKINGLAIQGVREY